MSDPHPALEEDPEQHIGAPVGDPWNEPKRMLSPSNSALGPLRPLRDATYPLDEDAD